MSLSADGHENAHHHSGGPSAGNGISVTDVAASLGAGRDRHAGAHVTVDGTIIGDTEEPSRASGVHLGPCGPPTAVWMPRKYPPRWTLVPHRDIP